MDNLDFSNDIYENEKVVDLDLFSNQYIAEQKTKGFESCFESEIYPTISTEAYSPVLPTTVRMGRLFKLRSSSQSFNKSGLLLKKFRGLAFIPIVTDRDSVSNEVKLCFGEELYKRMIFNYIGQKKFRYKNELIPGSKTITHITDLPELVSTVKRNLPKLQNNIASFYIKNNKNTVFDFSDIFELSYPTKEMLIRPNVLQTSPELILQMIYQSYYGTNKELLTLYKNYTTTTPDLSKMFDSVIISVPISTKNMRVASQYIDPKANMIPNSIRKNVEDSVALGIVKFIVDVLDDNPFSDSIVKRVLSEKIKSASNFIFLIHNETHGFYVDPIEFKEKGFKFDTMFRLIRASMKAIIGLNNSEIDVQEVDNSFSDNVSDDKVEEIVDSNISINNNFDEAIKNSVSESDTQTEKNVSISKDTVDTTNDINKDKSSLDKILSIQYNANKKSNLSNLKAFNNDQDSFEEDTSEDLSFDNEDDADLESLDDYSDELNDADKEINDTREFINEMNSNNGEFIKQKIIEQIKQDSPKDKLNPKQQARLDALRDKYKSVKFDDDRTFEEILNDTSSMQIDVTKTDFDTADDSFNYSLLKDMTKSYVNKTMAKDMINVVKSFSKDKSIPMNIVGFEKQDVSDQFNDMELYTFNLEGEDKRKHTIKFKFPKVDSDGFMYLNGNKKVLKKQWISKPITKTSPDEVYLSSDYNKTHIFRKGASLNRNTSALSKIITAVLSEPEKFKEISVVRGDNSAVNSAFVTTIEYDNIAKIVHKIELKSRKPNVVFYMNQQEIRNEIKLLKIPYEFKNNMVPIGIVGTHEVIEVDAINSSDSVAGKILKYIKDYNIFDDFDKFMNSVTVPKRKMHTLIELQSKEVPLVVFLASLFTFTKLLEASKVDYLILEKTDKFPEDKNIQDYAMVRFKDKVLYYNQYPIENALLFNGIAYMDVDNIEFAELDDIGVYLDYLYNKFGGRAIYKGWTAFKELFLTPITVEVLRELGQPTEFLEVFLYANSLLSDNSYLPPNDVRSYRIRDYEILNAYLYSAISTAYRDYKQKGKQRFSFSIPEDDIIKKLNKSLVLENYDTTNPLNEIRSQSAITFKGPQGVNSDRAFKLNRRGQTKSAIGIVGISNPENSTVGIVRQLTLNPRITSTRGFLNYPETDKEIQSLPSGVLLTAEEAAIPYITKDDPKRIGFTSSQTKHVIPANNFDFPIVGTGFEKTVLSRIGDDFGYKAKKSGVVAGVDEVNKFIVIKYDDGTSDRIDYGDRFVRNSDFFLPNNLSANVKAGDRVKKGDIVTYNKDFFKKHMGQLAFTQGTMSRVVVLEGEMTEEDSSCISKSLSEKLAHSVIKRKQIVLGARSNLVKTVKVNDFVRYGDPLVLYEDQKDIEADMSLLELLGTADDTVLNKLTRHKGEANYTGHITDMKVYWTCDPQELSESLRIFVEQYKKELEKQIKFEEKATGIPSAKRKELEVSVPTGSGNSINGSMMPKDGGVLIEYYIKHDANKRGGDKITVNSSLKSVVTQVVDDEIMAKRVTDYKFKDIDVVFSLISIDNRMVTSIWHTGYLQKLIAEYPKRLADEFLKAIE